MPEPRKPAIPRPLEHWFQDITAITDLRTLLENPVFQQASSTLLHAALPSFASLTEPDKNAVRLAWLAGYQDAFKDLHALTKMPTTRSAVAQEWGHIQ